ncbi:MAG: nitrogenase iron-molybdenum cofactor biosynthesis protein NifN [Sulfuricurvum sp. PC08-66]|nr:MAG: nitrogenase iron-molybdenum cofactor biosynthesis protein NifN [Sulfuricurvum sp. PC08-66]
MKPIDTQPHKPLQVNPIKHSQPMGAALAFMGIRNCLPLMHAAQGCASYTKVFYTRHFNEPIPLYNTSVSDITAVLDGGDYSILLAIENITSKDKSLPVEIIGLHTTGLTETKGDDIRGVGTHIEIPYCYVNTPDFEGGMQSGWALTAKALIDQHTLPSTTIDARTLLLLPNVSMQPIEVEKLKTFCEGFGYTVWALPDLSTSMDGYLSTGQGKLGTGAIGIEEIRALGRVEKVISIGESMRASAQALVNKNSAITHHAFDHIMGLETTDHLVEILMQEGVKPLPNVVRWRGRLQDGMLDTHFLIGSSHFVITGEPDMCAGMAALLRSVGGTIDAVIATTPSPILARIEAEQVIVGDLEDAKPFFAKAHLVISNFHAERMLIEQKLHHHHEVALVLRGFPNYEELGNQLKNDVLYEGSLYFLFEIANKLREIKHHA